MNTGKKSMGQRGQLFSTAAPAVPMSNHSINSDNPATENLGGMKKAASTDPGMQKKFGSLTTSAEPIIKR